MNPFQKWVNMKYFTRSEKIACILFILGVANRKQLMLVTGWSNQYVKDALQELRDNAKMTQQMKSLKEQIDELKQISSGGDLDNEELNMKIRRLSRQYKNQSSALEKKRDEWLVILKGSPKDPNFYTLGRKGIEMVKEIREESNSKFKNREKPKQQVNHFNGINEILMRVRNAGHIEKDWLSGREVSQNLAYYWNRKSHLVKKDDFWIKDKTYLPCQPDAMIILDEPFLLEFDANTETFLRLKHRMNGYLDLYYYFIKYSMSKKPLPSFVVWVCEDVDRKQEIEQAGKEALEEFFESKTIISKEDKDQWKSKLPYMIAFVEGEDTDFLIGKSIEVNSFI